MIVLLLPLIGGLVLFAAMMLAARWFVAANPAQLAAMARRGGSVAMILVGIFLVLRGQPALGLGLAAAGLGRLRGGAGGVGSAGAGFGGGPGRARRSARQQPAGSSSVRTATLEATLDHDTGEIDARVISGRFAARHLTQMAKAEVLGLWADCAGDGDSRLVVEAYLDRRHPEWRDDVERQGDRRAGGAGGSGRTDRSGAMTEEHAYEVLGLPPGASEADIRQRHRRLMKDVHPDQGGDTALAASINEAKDVLLGRRK